MDFFFTSFLAQPMSRPAPGPSMSFKYLTLVAVAWIRYFTELISTFDAMLHYLATTSWFMRMLRTILRIAYTKNNLTGFFFYFFIHILCKIAWKDLYN